MNKTIITHFYNEEFLLPWWLKHHRKLFDHGILIDYDSTDRSVEIIKEMCPTWEIVKSKNILFDHYYCDREVEEVEKNVDGWRISLTLTEFFIGNVDELIKGITDQTQIYIPTVMFCEYDPHGQLDPDKALWEQIKMGCGFASRSLHNFNVSYPDGRHYPGMTREDLQKQKALIFKYNYCIVGEAMLKRKKDLFTKVSERDRSSRLGTPHHYVSDDHLKDWYENFKNTMVCNLDEEIIKPFVKLIPVTAPSSTPKFGYSGHI